MCGIIGIIGNHNLSPATLGLISKACQKVAHRGPDHEQVIIGNGWAFGHRRLSIIDVSERANQPMTSANGNFTIVFNGEIYNHMEIRQELTAKGISFKTNSDTETLLEAFAAFGPSVLEKLNGFFAFSIYNKVDDTFFLARDRFGIKPLVYTVQDDFFAFGSEIKSILEFNVKKEINKAALGTYLQYSYIPAPHTIYENIKKLEPGYSITIDKDRTVSKHQFYRIPATEPDLSVSFDDAAKKVRDLTLSAVERRLISDVPLGSFLSGGVDSSIIAFAANQIRPIETFSMGFKDEPAFDESKYARKVAQHINCKHHEIEITNDELLATQLEAEKNLDEPFADSSAIAVNALSKFTRNHVTVALSGDGADVIFSGYNKHEALYRSMSGGATTPMMKVAAPILKKLKGSRTSKIGNLARKAKKFDEGMKLNLRDRYALWAKFTPLENTRRLIKDFHEIDQHSFIPELVNFNDILRTDCTLVLQNDMLKKVDSMSMLNSLEVRTPFLDHHLVDYVFSLPSTYKINGKGRKLILNEAFRSCLPDEIFDRKKHGFEVPLTRWFEGPLESRLNDLLLNKELIEDQGIFYYDSILTLFDEGIKVNRDTIWALYQFQVWYFQHFIS
ncbi:MAG: asparagine synthase (glutamine-hydrolyzing) [Flavobacteriales bacterium]|nr:asparagine synthase (glutamine-hydrolyzing) [Flavobacteriales bacterium]